MIEEKTLLQQIRDKEQEFSKKIETVKLETDAQIAAAGSERETVIREAVTSGKNSAEELYRREQRTTELEIDRMKKEAESETETTNVKGKRNLHPAVDKIIGYVTME
jgi:vacuolar-type H+-ATPase subunit H